MTVAARRATAALAGLVAVAGTAAASTPHPTRPPLRPDGAVTVFVAGDSLASAYAAEERPRTGWGQTLDLFLDDEVNVVDQAWPGQSTSTFLAEGRLAPMLAAAEPGDLVVVSFGHNDQMPDERHTDPATTYRAHLTTFVDRVRHAGATPVLATSVERRRFDETGRAVPTLGDYAAAMRRVGADTGTPVVDLQRLSLARWDRLGPRRTRSEFLWVEPGVSGAYPEGVHDDTHLQAAGAIAVARLVARELQRQRLLAPGEVEHLAAQPDAGDVTWPVARPVAG